MTDAPNPITAAHHSGADSGIRFGEAPLPIIVHTELSVDPGEAFAADLHQRISRRAYELAEQRGFAPGGEIADWLRAEREVLAAPDAAIRLENQLGG